ncbi:MAG: 3-oxoacyl-ACP reductase [Deltaproteobacteria bacterium]|nr:MAG: 3-oxoacyl-ACP reductase [Deltaproteobacteria bacterium]
MNKDYEGLVIIVTGASRGIGQQIALELAHRGSTLVVHYNGNREMALTTLEKLEGGSHVLVQADLSDVNAAGPMIDEVIEKTGRLNVLVNNAAIYEFHPIATTPFLDWQKSWEKTISTNLLGPVHLSYHAAQRMMKSGGGRIINITSRGAFRGEPDAPAYGASKAALNACSQSLAQALAPHNIFVYAIAPGFIETDMAAIILNGPKGDSIRAQSPLNRVGRPAEIAEVAAWLAVQAPEYLTGCIIDANGASYLRT